MSRAAVFTASLLLGGAVVACSDEAGDPDGRGTGGRGTGGSSSAPAPTNEPSDLGFIMTPPPDEQRRCGDEDVNILLLVDRSGSMNCNLPPITESGPCEDIAAKVDQGQPSKWEVTVPVLTSALNRILEASDVTVRIGLSYFSTDDVCGARSTPAVPVSDATQPHLDLLRQNLVSETPRGGTPLVGSLVLAYKHLHQQLPHPGEGHVILVSDGADSCLSRYQVPGENHLARLVQDEAPKALAAGIKTWAVGIPGSEPARSVLSRLAVAGGTARSSTCDQGSEPTSGDCHYDATVGDFEAIFAEALDEIIGFVTCEIVR